MISKNSTNSFPPVEFDTTLYDLLLADAPNGEIPKESLCHIKPNSDPDVGGKIANFSDKYLIHSAQLSDADDLAHLQLEVCNFLLTFFAGPMNVIYMAADGYSDDQTLCKDAVDKTAKKNASVIGEKQRMNVKTHANIDAWIADHDGSKIRWAFGMDVAERLPYLFHPDTIYLLNSKRWLAESETLKSANDMIIDCEIKCPDHRRKINEHKEEWYYGGKDCQKCVAGVEAEIRRVHDIIQQREVPFVLKLTQSLSAVGTNIVQTEQEKTELLEYIGKYLSEHLPRITTENAHLYPTSLILSDFVKGETMALNFFIKRDGSVVYLGTCQQLGTGETGRQTTAITYGDQEKLEPRYRRVLDKIGKAIHKEGYYGVIGADIMEDVDGNQITIDLNVRTPLSLVLYLFKKHFWKDRGYGVAVVYECILLDISREELEDKFHEEFEDAKIVLLGSTQFGNQDKWAYGMIVAGKEKQEVDKLSDRIFEHEVVAKKDL